ncbi:MAG: cell division protein ZapA [Clostridia bacterium]|nr:cell division protein ZapA [Clostridia bacterium]
MPRYTITIADVDLYINTEESPKMVETLVSTVDRRMRDIAIMSPRLSKSESAILCAIDYCADKLKGESAAKEMKKEIAALSAELEALKKNYADLCAETEEVRRENRVMNELISKNLSMAATMQGAAKPTTAGEQLAIETAAETVPATEVMFDNETAESTPKKTRRACRSKANDKVGDMFDMLTFKDV